MIEKKLKDGRYLQIKIEYDKGGVNYFTGNVRRRGYYAYFMVVQKGGGFKIYAPLHDENFTVFVMDTKRYSSKTHNKLNETLDKHKQEFFKLYNTRDVERIINLLRGY